MADSEDVKQGLENLQQQLDGEAGKSQDVLFLEAVAREESIEYLHKLWADFHLHIIKPYITPRAEVEIIHSEQKDSGKVYAIFDSGNVFSSSRAEDMVIGNSSTGRLLNTVEKMIRLGLIRIKEQLDAEGGGDGDGSRSPKIEVALLGHEFAKRKAFEVFMGMRQRINISNYEPIGWGERRLNGLERQAEQGFALNISALRY